MAIFDHFYLDFFFRTNIFQFSSDNTIQTNQFGMKKQKKLFAKQEIFALPWSNENNEKNSKCVGFWPRGTRKAPDIELKSIPSCRGGFNLSNM